MYGYYELLIVNHELHNPTRIITIHVLGLFVFSRIEQNLFCVPLKSKTARSNCDP